MREEASPEGYRRFWRYAFRVPARTQKTPVPAQLPPYSRGKLPGSGAVFSRYILTTSNVNGPDQPGAKARRATELTAFKMNLALSDVRPMQGTQGMVQKLRNPFI